MAHLGSTARFGAARGRRLAFEFLESRDLLAVIRLVDWNTLNGPNDEIGDANFQTILAAIGNETVQGNTKRLDILALQETDPAGPGGNSIGRIESILDALYPSTDYASIVSSLDGGGDATGFVYDTSTVSLLEAVEVAPESLTHTVLRAKFRPIDTPGDSDFFVYTVHLKSGDTGADQSVRAFEATVLRNDIDALGEGAHVMFVGDLNMKSSFEDAYINLAAAGPGQLHDLADAPGSWFNNASFKLLHTQNPQSDMDDRFDLQLATGELFDGVGLEYVQGSFHVFGNNGSHTLNAAITTGSGASVEVLAALAAASDHLPIVADFELVPSTPNVRITQTGGGTKVVEGGLFDTYNVVLDTVPAANVTVTVTPDTQLDVGNGPGSAIQLVFTPANALTPQTVVVHAVNDLLMEGNHTGLIVHDAASSDPNYNLLSIDDIIVQIVDNDAPVIVINEIDVDQAGTDAAEFVELYDGGVGNFPLDGLVVVFYNGSNDQSYAAFDLDGLTTDANGFFVLGNAGVPGVQVVFAGNFLQNGADAVALYRADAAAFPNGTPVTTVNLLDAIVYDTNDSDDPGLLVLLEPGQPQVNEHENGAAAGETQSLSRVPDGGAPRQTVTYVAKTPTPGAPNQAQLPGVVIIQSGNRVDLEEGGATDSYQIALQTIPTHDVVITVDPDDQADLGAGPGVPIMLTFTPANAIIPQTVHVAAVDDLVPEGTHTSTITHTAVSADSGYNGITIGNVIANIVDNDEPELPVIVITELMYNPASDESLPGLAEWIEVVNIGNSPVDLSGWLFDDEDSSNWGAIPAGTILQPNQVAVFFDEAFTSAATFRAEWSIPDGALVVGIPWGSLANEPSATNEILELRDSLGEQIDVVNYDDSSPWPSISGSGGPSIHLISPLADNNVGANWFGSTVGIRNAISPTGPTFHPSDVGSPGWLPLAGDYNSDFVVDGGDYVAWRNSLGSTMDPRADGSGPTEGVPDGLVDALDYAWWKAHYGNALVLGSGGSGGGGLATTTSIAPEPSRPAAGNSPKFAGFATTLEPSAGRSAAPLFAGRPVAGRTSDAQVLLLALDRARLPARHGDAAWEEPHADPASDHDPTDEAFARLGDEEWRTAIL